MPFNTKSFLNAFLLVFVCIFAVAAQDIVSSAATSTAPSTADVMRQRVAKAKAFIVVKNYPAAIYELENIRRESSDPTLDSVINVLLMNSYLEQGDYKRAQDFLTQLSKDQSANKPNAAANYFAAAAQVIKSARTQLERYHSLGLNVSDRTLPEAASADVERMRTTLELVVEQSREFGKDKRYTDTAIALLEGATAARSSLAKDDYDANRWRSEVADARELMANSQSTVINAVNPDPQTPGPNLIAGNTRGNNSTPSVLLPVSSDEPPVNTANRPAQQNRTPVRPVSNTPADETAVADKPVENTAGEKPAESTETNQPGRRRVVIESAPRQEPVVNPEQSNSFAETSSQPAETSPLEVGSLVGYATKKTSPVYPSIARNMRMTGIVKVNIVVDEEGRVIEVQDMDGPSLLQDAAQSAVRKWKFRPFLRNGEPVRVLGYVSFNFSL